MYKLLLVDDEPEIREGLREVVPFQELGFEVVGEAANGLMALQLAEQLKPDLVITDIRMPLMDGLSFCRQARQLLPTTQFIILSGYDDFEYARQAIEVKTLGYLLKPISAKEFVQMLEGAKRSLDEAAHQRSDLERLRRNFTASLPTLKESLLSALLSGSLSPRDALLHAGRYGLRLEAPAYAVCILQVGQELGQDRIGDEELLPLAVNNIVAEILGEDLGELMLRYGGQTAVLLRLKENSEAAFRQALEKVEAARGAAAHYLECEVFAGVSTLCEDIAALPAAAKQAVSAADQAVLSRLNHTLCVKDVERGSNTQLIADELQLRRMSSALKAGEQQLALEQLDQLMDRCLKGSPSPKAYQIYLMEVLMSLLRVLPDMGLDRADFDEDFDRITKAVFTSCPPVDEAREQLSALLKKLLSSIKDSRSGSGRQIALEAEEYLRQNYHREDLSLDDLCLHLHLSPSYFSALFKRETKRTFHQYLTALRMDRALQLLTAQDLRTSQVAREVGLPDPSYFSYSFKKHFGFPPSQARKRGEGA